MNARNEIIVHPLAALFPMMPDDELAELADDILANGLQFDLVLDTEGRLLDGRNRLKACEIAGVEPRFTTHDGDPAIFILSVNVNRRHLNKGQRAIATAMLTPPSENKGGRGKKTTPLNGEVSAEFVRMARVVLKHDEKGGLAVLNGAEQLIPAYERVSAQEREKETAAERKQRLLGQLNRTRPDLAAQVVAGDLSADDAIAQMKADEEEHKQQRIAATQNLVSWVRGADRPLDYVDHMRRMFDPALAASLGEPITSDRLRAASAFFAALAETWESPND